jgi:hypothetical protein
LFEAIQRNAENAVPGVVRDSAHDALARTHVP